MKKVKTNQKLFNVKSNQLTILQSKSHNKEITNLQSISPTHEIINLNLSSPTKEIMSINNYLKDYETNCTGSYVKKRKLSNKTNFDNSLASDSSKSLNFSRKTKSRLDSSINNVSLSNNKFIKSLKKYDSNFSGFSLASAGKSKENNFSMSIKKSKCKMDKKLKTYISSISF